MKTTDKKESSILGMIAGLVLCYIMMHFIFIFPLIGMASKKYLKTNNNETAGPPLAEAWPIAENILAPIMAATPIKVKSRTPKLRIIE